MQTARHLYFGLTSEDPRRGVDHFGKEDDIQVGLTYFGARYYNAALGRWISPDPLTIHGLGSDLNPYAFVNGSPLSFTDPLGLNGKEGSGTGQACNPDDQTCTSTIGFGDIDWKKTGQWFKNAASNIGDWFKGAGNTFGNDVGKFWRGLGGEGDGPAKPVMTPSSTGVGDNSNGYSFGLASGSLNLVATSPIAPIPFIGPTWGDVPGLGGALTGGQTWLAAHSSGGGFAAGTLTMAAVPFVVPGGQEGALENAGSRFAALDTNALIGAIEGGQASAVDAALAGRQPVVPFSAAKEFLVKGDAGALREFLNARGGSIAPAPQTSTVQRMLGLGLQPNDARISAAAADLGVPLITRDKGILKLLPLAITF